MAIPQKREDLLSMGYVFDNEARCRGCGGARIAIWLPSISKRYSRNCIPTSRTMKRVSREACRPFTNQRGKIKCPANGFDYQTEPLL